MLATQLVGRRRTIGQVDVHGPAEWLQDQRQAFEKQPVVIDQQQAQLVGQLQMQQAHAPVATGRCGSVIHSLHEPAYNGSSG